MDNVSAKYIKARIEEIKEKYNGDCDTMPGLPQVMYTDLALALINERLLYLYNELREEHEELRTVVNGILEDMSAEVDLDDKTIYY